MNTAITRLLNIKYPIFQGGMAWVAEAALAAAVSEAGGLGIIAGGAAPADVIRDEIRKLREITDKPFAVNIMLMSPFASELAEMVTGERVPVVTTGAGSPAKFIPMWKEAGITVIPVVASTAHAKMMQRAGADAIVAEGCEAGGHIGELTTMALVPQVCDAVTIPVVAAGGIADSRGAAAAFMLGAEGIQCGTVFLTAEECRAHDNYKNSVLNAGDISTIVTGRSTGHPIRSLKTKFTRAYMAREKEGASVEELEEFASGSLRKAVMDGNGDDGSFMAGQIAGLVNSRGSVKDIIEGIFAGIGGICAERSGLWK